MVSTIAAQWLYQVELCLKSTWLVFTLHRTNCRLTNDGPSCGTDAKEKHPQTYEVQIDTTTQIQSVLLHYALKKIKTLNGFHYCSNWECWVITVGLPSLFSSFTFLCSPIFISFIQLSHTCLLHIHPQRHIKERKNKTLIALQCTRDLTQVYLELKYLGKSPWTITHIPKLNENLDVGVSWEMTQVDYVLHVLLMIWGKEETHHYSIYLATL